MHTFPVLGAVGTALQTGQGHFGPLLVGARARGLEFLPAPFHGRGGRRRLIGGWRWRCRVAPTRRWAAVGPRIVAGMDAAHRRWWYGGAAGTGAAIALGGPIAGWCLKVSPRLGGVVKVVVVAGALIWVVSTVEPRPCNDTRQNVNKKGRKCGSTVHIVHRQQNSPNIFSKTRPRNRIYDMENIVPCRWKIFEEKKLKSRLCIAWFRMWP